MNCFISLFVLLISVSELYAKTQFGIIINGDLTDIKTHPYYAYLAYKDRKLKCGGTIVKTNLILTAAHCLTPKDFEVYVGINTPKDLWTHKAHKVKNIIKLRKYRGQVGYDIGLALLADHVTLGPRVQTIDVAFRNPRIDAEVTVIGFGRKDCTTKVWDATRNGLGCAGLNSQYLRSATVKVIKKSRRVMYTKANNQNTCYGDSGGPVIFKNRVVGVISSGQHADCTGFDTQVAVAPFYSWITKYAIFL